MAYTNSAANTHMLIIVVVQVVLSPILTVGAALLPSLLMLHSCSFGLGHEEVALV